MLARLAPIALALLAACSRAPDRITAVAEWERGPATTAVVPIKSDPNVAAKRPFPCCSIEEPVGFFDDYGYGYAVEPRR